MRFLKNFDYFKKESNDITTQTTVGAVMSIFTVLSISILMIINIYEYTFPEIKKEPIIFQDVDNAQTNVMFYFKVHYACSVINVYYQDEMGKGNLEKPNIRLRFSKDDQYLGEYTGETVHNLQSLLSEINSHEKCIFRFAFPISKINGVIKATLVGNQITVMQLMSQHPEIYKNFNFPHQIELIKFGRYEDIEKIFRNFGENQHTHFKSNYPDFLDSKRKKYDYFLKIIPHLFVERYGFFENSIMGYEYSMDFQETNNISQDDFELPHLTINLDFSYVTMKVFKKQVGFLHFLTHNCAIIGGVFVISSLINKILNLLF